MAEDGTVSVEEAEKLMESAQAEESTPSTGETEVDESSETSDDSASGDADYSDAEPDKLIETLKAKDSELEKSKKSYSELRSLADRKFNEQKAEMAELRGQLKTVLATVGKHPEADPRQTSEDQEKFDTKWIEQINADPGKNTIAFFRGMTGELLSTIEKKLEEKLSGVSSKIREVNPAYTKHKEFIDALKEKGFDDDAALNAVLTVMSKMPQNKTVSQPGKPVPPGRINGVGRKAAIPVEQKLALEPYEINILKSSGLSDKDITSITKELAAEMQ